MLITQMFFEDFLLSLKTVKIEFLKAGKRGKWDINELSDFQKFIFNNKNETIEK